MDTVDDRLTRLEKAVEENTQITTQVRDLLSSFRIIAAVCKWLSLVGGALAAGYHGVDALRGLPPVK